jgi:hypothetical protein
MLDDASFISGMWCEVERSETELIREAKSPSGFV